MDIDVMKKATVFKALSNPVRLEMVLMLHNTEMSVNEIAEKVNSTHPELDRTSISKHLTVLKKNELVSSRDDGNKKLYTLKATCLVEMMHCTNKISR